MSFSDNTNLSIGELKDPSPAGETLRAEYLLHSSEPSGQPRGYRDKDAAIGGSLSCFLDCTRWLAALAVAAGHLRQLVFAELPSFGPFESLGWKFFYFVTGFGHQAVILFFVLSGFLVGGSVALELRQATFSWRRYFIKRVSRLYPVFVLGVICGYALDSLGLRCFNATGIYTNSLPHQISSLAFDASQGLNWATIWSNLFMLQTIVAPPLGTNSPLWSLANEFWYYLLFPLCAVLVVRKETKLGRRFVYVLLLVTSVTLLPRDLLIYFGIWVMGALLHLVRKPLSRVSVAGVLCTCVLVFSRALSTTFTDFLIAASFSVLLCSVKFRVETEPKAASVHKALAGFSYSLYIFHFPLLIFAGAVLHDIWGIGLRMPPGLQAAVTYLALLAVLISCSYLLSLLSEAQTPRIRKALTQMLGLRLKE